MKRQIEIPVNNNSIVTSRSLDTSHPDNQNLYESSLEFLDLLKEVKIRFDTNPRCYQREDYQKLIELLRLSGGGSGKDIDIDIEGEGNVITDLISEGNTIIATKEEIEAEQKEVFPDYAFWQKEYIKKGSEVLWAPVLSNESTPDEPILFPEPKKVKNKEKKLIKLNFPTDGNHKIYLTWLEIGRLLDEEPTSRSNLLFQSSLLYKGEIKVSDLQTINTSSEYICFRLEIGDKGRIFEEDSYILIENTPYLILDNGEINIPTEDITSLLNTKEVIRISINKSCLLNQVKKLILYISDKSYFSNSPTKNRLYTLSWNKDKWEFKQLKQTLVKCKYHQLSVSLHNYDGETIIDRNTWRVYSEPEVSLKTYTIDVKNDERFDNIPNHHLHYYYIDYIDGKLQIPYFIWAGEGYDPEIIPSLDWAVISEALSTYRRHECDHFRHRECGVWYARKKDYRWTSYPQDVAFRCKNIFTLLLRQLGKEGRYGWLFLKNVNTRKNWWKIKVSQCGNKHIIFLRIPYTYKKCTQSHSWSNRSRTAPHTHKIQKRFKLFYKDKIACFKVSIDSRLNYFNPVSISMDKIPFIMPKICY